MSSGGTAAGHEHRLSAPRDLVGLPDRGRAAGGSSESPGRGRPASPGPYLGTTLTVTVAVLAPPLPSSTV